MESIGFIEIFTKNYNSLQIIALVVLIFVVINFFDKPKKNENNVFENFDIDFCSKCDKSYINGKHCCKCDIDQLNSKNNHCQKCCKEYQKENHCCECGEEYNNNYVHKCDKKVTHHITQNYCNDCKLVYQEMKFDPYITSFKRSGEFDKIVFVHNYDVLKNTIMKPTKVYSKKEMDVECCNVFEIINHQYIKKLDFCIEYPKYCKNYQKTKDFIEFTETTNKTTKTYRNDNIFVYKYEVCGDENKYCEACNIFYCPSCNMHCCKCNKLFENVVIKQNENSEFNTTLLFCLIFGVGTFGKTYMPSSWNPYVMPIMYIFIVLWLLWPILFNDAKNKNYEFNNVKNAHGLCKLQKEVLDNMKYMPKTIPKKVTDDNNIIDKHEIIKEEEQKTVKEKEHKSVKEEETLKTN